ncbi:TetR/AcrR family transcriptional regulator [Cryptosporangium arvum]|uniref:TetR/AcrR family transcriptional regulator n=1 Tax=Cryptosporangium arvum TaxID=80871 RepID=UPI0004B1705C|nr:TetR/AcrR family transcriptional regulator [Cryptosporangium arvum]
MSRVDAERNRRHLVTVARGAFAADGLDLPTREIARRAGLGVATVYRHFPARADLLDAVLADQVAACEADLAGALAERDPWRAISRVVRGFAERQVSDRGLNEVILGTHAAGAAFAGQRRAHAGAVAGLVERAHAAGQLRAGVTVGDVRLVFFAIASLRVSSPEALPAAIRRLTDTLLAGLRAAAPGDAPAHGAVSPRTAVAPA